MNTRSLARFLEALRSEQLAASLRDHGQPIGRTLAERSRALARALLTGEVPFGALFSVVHPDAGDLEALCEEAGLNPTGSRTTLEERLSVWWASESGQRDRQPELSPSEPTVEPRTDGSRDPHRSDAWDWWPTEEVFDMNGQCFDLDKAKRLICASPRPVEAIRTMDYAGLIVAIPVIVDGRRKKRADISVPLILATLKNGGRVVIDGWHRLARAADEGIRELPAVVLTFEESKRVR